MTRTESEWVHEVLTAYTLLMAERRRPNDIARLKDRDDAVVFVVRQEILTPEQVAPHVNITSRLALERAGLVPPEKE
jgi:hypothetical protein